MQSQFARTQSEIHQSTRTSLFSLSSSWHQYCGDNNLVVIFDLRNEKAFSTSCCIFRLLGQCQVYRAKWIFSRLWSYEILTYVGGRFLINWFNSCSWIWYKNFILGWLFFILSLNAYLFWLFWKWNPKFCFAIFQPHRLKAVHCKTCEFNVTNIKICSYIKPKLMSFARWIYKTSTKLMYLS